MFISIRIIFINKILIILPINLLITPQLSPRSKLPRIRKIITTIIFIHYKITTNMLQPHLLHQYSLLMSLKSRIIIIYKSAIIIIRKISITSKFVARR